MEGGDVVVAREPDLLHVTINRPEKRNPLSRLVLGRLRQVFDEARDDPALKLAVVTGAGEKSFAAGGDLRELEAVRTHEDASGFSDEAFGALEAIRRFPLPVIAALNGDALGGGGELAIACDMRIMAPHARIGFIQGRLAITTSWGGGPDLMRLVGSARGLSLLSRGAIIGGPEAVAIGLADEAVPEAADFAEAVRTFAAPIRQQTPHVLRAFKAQALAYRVGVEQAERRTTERDLFAKAWIHDDHWAAAAKILAPRRA